MAMLIVILSVLIVQVCSKAVIVDTTSGRLLGTQIDGVASFKGIRFAHPPVGHLRWEPPVPFISSEIHNATSLGPACVQQVLYGEQDFMEKLYGASPPENEDCLFLNVWAPTPISGPLKAVILWIHGGALDSGSASLAEYDGTSFAKNQDIVFVSFNYRLNVFGFPTSQDLSVKRNNFGFLDQELALAWVQDNIAQFGGDKAKVTIMGHSAGSFSVSLAITRRNSTVAPPFRAAMLLSGFAVSTSPTPDFSKFDAFATAMNCNQTAGPRRLHCLRTVPACTIRNYTNGPHSSGRFNYMVDDLTAYDDPLQRIRTDQFARVPILLGNAQDDGTIFTYNTSESLCTYLAKKFGSYADLVPPALVRALYPELNDPQVIAAVERDTQFRCPAKLWGDAFISSGIKSVHRYSYGAVFTDLQPFPDLGAWHGSELPILFGTYNTSTATTSEVELSQSLQTAFANFAKNPEIVSPAPNSSWPPYEPGLLGIARNPTLAKIAYEENVAPDDFINLVQPISIDEPCIVWDHFLDYRPSASAGEYRHGTSMVDGQVGVQDSTPGLSLRLQVLG
ncbi:Carboxylesterase [Russula vinacea]|nr:Carboxylesterase [Russula vinacea]